MFTSVDKAIVASIMGILFIVQYFTGFNTNWISADTLSVIIGVLNPLIVWATPNKPVA